MRICCFIDGYVVKWEGRVLFFFVVDGALAVFFLSDVGLIL
jgi:hypothetical protein